VFPPWGLIRAPAAGWLPGAVMKTSAVEVDYRHTRQALQAIFDLARAQDVEKGGRYDARSGAINIYTHPCNIAAMQEEGTPMSSLYALWAEEHRSWRVEMEEGFSFEDLLMELGTLEEGAWREGSRDSRAVSRAIAPWRDVFPRQGRAFAALVRVLAGVFLWRRLVAMKRCSVVERQGDWAHKETGSADPALMLALEALYCLTRCRSLVCEGSSSRSMKRVSYSQESWERSSDRSSGQLAGKSSTVTWRTIWRNQGATFSPAVVAAFWTCSWRLASTER
jgi:hypothetical protein